MARDGGTDENTRGGAEGGRARFSLGVTRRKRNRNEYIGMTAQGRRFRDKV